MHRKVVNVPFFIWNNLHTPLEKTEYLRNLLATAGWHGPKPEAQQQVAAQHSSGPADLEPGAVATEASTEGGIEANGLEQDTPRLQLSRAERTALLHYQKKKISKRQLLLKVAADRQQTRKT